jgi:myo-inositol 2-dehydrogenase/D-chiro-inositol 1-dehydrogenase
VREEFTGTKGKIYLDNSTQKTFAVDHKGNVIWRYRAAPAPAAEGAEGAKGKGRRNRGGDPDPYQVEHDTLQACIRENKPINNAYYGAESTMTAVLGRMATYCGTEVTWEEALASKVQHMPNVWKANHPSPLTQTAGIAMKHLRSDRLI